MIRKAPFRVLVVTAHPDDMEFGCAGTLARWSDEGADITLTIVTDGSTGTQDRELMGERLEAVRKEESEKAAAVVGIGEVLWLGYRDGYVE
ncbi:MAG TPA: PIG-L family deacetylase, partial [Actinomycetota bacterium]|nr:PIG-L family deacetylase [Actinomycetota bacterium]